MTHFRAEFPQHDIAIDNPCAADYRDAATLFGEVAREEWGDRSFSIFAARQGDRFCRVVRMLEWVPKK
jgi:hypothetical protein